MLKLLKGLFGKQPPADELDDGPPVLDGERLAPYRRPCWVPKVEGGDGGPRASKFSGTVALRQGESWPLCPNCKRPMQLFLQLNAADLPEGFTAPWGEGLLQFFYCTTSKPLCEIDCEAYAPFAQSTLLRVLPLDQASAVARPPREAFPAKRIVGWEILDDLPGWEELRNFGFADGDAEEVMNAGYPHERDKLSGWPAWVQGVEYPQCPDCGAEMKMLFQIDSNDNLPYMFGDAGCGHITYCEKHPRVLAFGWACG